MLYFVEMNMVGKGHMTLDCEGHMVRVRILGTHPEASGHGFPKHTQNEPAGQKMIKMVHGVPRHPYIGRSRSLKKLADDML